MASSDHGAVVECKSKEDFDTILAQSKAENKPVLVDFSATWCGPCRIIAPIFVKLSNDNPNIIFVKIDVDEVPDVCNKYGINAMPTFILLPPGSEDSIQNVLGANVNKLEKMIEQANAMVTASASS